MKRFLPILLIMLLIPWTACAEFSESSSVYDPDLAQWALTNAELCGTPEMHEGILKMDGYRMIGAYNHRREAGDRRHVAAYTVLEKPLEDGGTAVVIAVRGTGDEEWPLNFDIMPSGNYDLDYAENFALAAEDVLNTLADYLDALSSPVFLVTGHSRGAAVANILGARLTDRFGAENVFAYTFATPRTVRGDYPDYDNIFNVINPADIVTYLPLPQWGFVRYGVDLVLPVDDASPELLAAAKEAYRTRSDKSGVFSAQEDGSAMVLAAVETIAELVPTLSEGFNAQHALSHAGAPEEGEDGLTISEFSMLMFVGRQSLPDQPADILSRLTQAENDFTPLIVSLKPLTSGASAWHNAHRPAVYGAWMTAALK